MTTDRNSEAVAWMDKDGSRVILAKVKQSDNAAYRSATSAYTVPLYPPKVCGPTHAASIISEAAEVLEAVGASGVALPDNWRWPLADELSGIVGIMLASPPASIPVAGLEALVERWRNVDHDGWRADEAFDCCADALAQLIQEAK